MFFVEKENAKMGELYSSPKKTVITKIKLFD